MVCLGYKGYVIKEYFSNYFLHMSDVTIDLRDNSMRGPSEQAEPWRVTLVDTGRETMTGGRLKRVREYLGDETFMPDLWRRRRRRRHLDARRVPPRARQAGDGHRGSAAGALRVARDRGRRRRAHSAGRPSFQEKPRGDGGWMNGGFFVLEPAVLDHIDDDETRLGARAARAAWPRDGELMAYRHRGFWPPCAAG